MIESINSTTQPDLQQTRSIDKWVQTLCPVHDFHRIDFHRIDAELVPLTPPIFSLTVSIFSWTSEPFHRRGRFFFRIFDPLPFFLLLLLPLTPFVGALT